MRQRGDARMGQIIPDRKYRSKAWPTRAVAHNGSTKMRRGQNPQLLMLLPPIIDEINYVVVKFLRILPEVKVPGVAHRYHPDLRILCREYVVEAPSILDR